jgi:hypothetical protein
MNIEKLKKQHEKVCNDYIKAFCKKQDLEFQFWVADIVGEIACFGDIYFFDFTEIVHDIKTEQPPEKIIQWVHERLESSNNFPDYYLYTKSFKFTEDTTDLVNHTK